MAGTGPKLPESPLELLTTRFSDEPVTNKFFTPMSFGAVCLAASVLGNYFTKRPLFSGMWYIISTLCNALISFL